MRRVFQIKKWIEVEATIKIQEDEDEDIQESADYAAGCLIVMFDEDVTEDPNITILDLGYHTNPHSVEVNDITDEKGEEE